ncbi:MAG: ATPase domain-containing protein [Natronomonas sp.]
MQEERISTGVAGLDEILDGGLIRGRNTLVRGPPGSGKTIFGLHFLSAAGPRETALYVNMGEPQEYVEETVRAFGLSEEIQFHNLSPTKEQFAEDQSYTLFESTEVEQPDFIAELRETIEAVEPDRVLLDPITEFRFLAGDERQFRRVILGLLDYLKERDSTVMLTSQAGGTVTDDDLQFLVDAVISLEAGTESRTLDVSKFRGSSSRRGQHFYEISADGLAVWPSLVPGELTGSADAAKLSSGVPELDEMLNGGIDHGTVTILSGPTGVGKTTTGMQFLTEAALDGRRSCMFQFEEAERTLKRRADSISIPVQQAEETGKLSIIEIEPDEYSLGEFENMVREVVADGVELVMLDGATGFQQNLRGVDEPTQALVRVGRFLRAAGVTTFLVNEVHKITGTFQATEERTSNLADNIVFLRHVEYRGEMKKVIGTLKMRTSNFERNLRELRITSDGIRVGEPLGELRGILTGTPEWKSSKENQE